MRFILLTITFFLFGSLSFSQLGSVTLTTTKCAHISTRLDVNYNDPTFDVLTDYRRGITYYSRGFIEFDLSSIPTNAIIISAKLKITNAGGTYVVNPWVTKLIQSSWVEGTVKASAQPTISSSSSDWETSYSTSGNDIEIDVKSTVQRMVYGAVSNYGWCIQVQNEAVGYDSGTSFESDEASSDEPELIIEYYLPVTFSDVVIEHESGTGESDGSISFSHTALDASGHTYTWINASGTQLQTGSISTIEDLSYGWYGLEITGNTNGETAYYGFLVGTQCRQVIIAYTTRPEYTQNTYNYNWISTGGIDYRDYNFGNSTYLLTTNRLNSTWSDAKSYLDFNLWMDDAFIVNQADLLVQGFSHVNGASTNPAILNKVTGYWNEELVTWNTAPTNNASVYESVPNTTSSTQDATWDFISLWDEWKVNNNTNYGALFQLEEFDDDGDAGQQYISPNSASNEPVWTFTLGLYDGESCAQKHANLEYKLDGSYYVMKDGKIRFIFNQEYDTDDLVFNIYNFKDEVVKTNANFPTIQTTNGDNYITLDVTTSSTCLDGKGFFYLEVINSKKERTYLRFYNDYDDCESLPTE